MKVKINDEVPENVTAFLGPLEPGKVYQVPANDGETLIREGLAEHAEVGADVERHEDTAAVTFKSRTLDGFDAYDEGETYHLPVTLARYFTGNGWATLAMDAPKPRGKGPQPKDTREATDEDADRLEREIHQPARERSPGYSIRQVNTGTNEVWKGDPFEFAEGTAGHVVDAQTGQALTPESPKAQEARDRATTLDVQDVKTEGGASF